MEANRLTGRPSNPPREFPATLRPVHVDSYYAPNRQIQYTRDYTVRVKPDCSLEEGESFTATLDSLSGHCEIDMLARTAKGQCPVNGFASAPPFHVSTAAQDRQVREEMLRMAHMPGMAAMIAMTNNTAAPGATRRILGIECEEVNMPAMYTRACSAKGGSFPRPHTMILDGAWGEYKSVASEAKLDALLTNAIFTPYVAGGFSITSGNEN